ncbi:hypothetical protein [Vibrio parahaemolyticus]|uniref:hypothetical protein n=3 Tax=Vibrio parahaemolyticus TaxID=670 RepID=UPI000789ABF6|nr:hypothetical protein [Vibrio parahaemolyticus]KYO58432.1 hypothetical protein AU461_23230 [Vibrio parahaemolyticus]TPB41778.1 hypothetical protein DXJ78_24085 [Vibrio parahaemolyticus]
MNDVIVKNEYRLDSDQLAVLQQYANGLDGFDICQALELTPAELKSLELDIQARLDAKTTPHMVSRAWQLGILASRFMCAALLIVTSLSELGDDMLRLRTAGRTTQNPTTIARVMQAGRNKEV